jgi:hypothetical protein
MLPPISSLNTALDYWLKELDNYDFDRLVAKPTAVSWSLGQVYMHLINETEHFIEQAKICASVEDNVHEEASAEAKAMFLNNSFPDEIIEGPPTNANTQQPNSKEQILSSLMKIKDEIKQLERIMLTNRYNGKTRHPGLNYFNASEWLQFAEMHLRHHLRQKKRIDAFLGTSSP